MPRQALPQVVTANHLIEGDVVYLAATGQWVRDLCMARVFDDPAMAQDAMTQAAKRAHEVVGVYLADVRATPNGPEPAHFREDFRRRGPSNYAHGKQEAA